METYFEKNLIINGRELVYKGIFKDHELFSLINRTLEKKDYEKREKKTEETVTESGRSVLVELRPFKDKTNYVRLVIKIKIYLDNVTEIVKEKEGRKERYQQGDVKLVFDSWSLTDNENRWGMKPWFYFLKGVINKYMYTFPLESGFTSELVTDTAYIYGQVKKLLKSYEGKIEKSFSEEEIRKEVEEEIKKENQM